MHAAIRFSTLYGAAVLLSAFAGRHAAADVIKLKNGGEVRGKLVNPRPQPGEPLQIRTLSGTLVTIARKEAQFLTHRPLRVEQYETKARETPDTVAAQMQLADWCRENRLDKQRKTHLRRVIELDPDHRAARFALGYSKYDGKWMTRDEWNRSRGLVKYKGRYITPEELALIQKSQAEVQRERKWFRNVRLWKTWLSSDNADRRKTALENFSRMTDPDAVAALRHNFAEESSKRLRIFYAKVLARIKGPKPVPALVALALHDGDYEVRYTALNAISADQYAVAMPYFVQGLKDASVAVVRRAGEGLRRTGNENAVPPLIDALVTTHLYKVRVPRQGVGMSTNGSRANPGRVALPPQIELMLRSGQLPNGVIVQQSPTNRLVPTRVVTVKRDHRNNEVLKALERITGQSFGYNKRDWKLWLASSNNGQGVASP